MLATPSTLRSLSSGDLHRAGRGRGARRRLRKGGRARGMESDVAFHLLHHLMDVAVEHRHRAEALEQLKRPAAVLGAPAPFRINRPERDVREHHDRRRGRAVFHVGRKPGELVGAEIAEPAGFQIDDIDQADEMHTARIEAVPAGAFAAAAITIQIELAVLVEEIVLARHVMHVETRLRDDAVGVVEFGHLRQMADVAGMKHERRLCRHGVDLADRLFQRAARIGIGRLVETDMAIGDLQEGQSAHFFRRRPFNQAGGARHPGGDRPQNPGADPGHAFQHFPPVQPVALVKLSHFFLLVPDIVSRLAW